VIAQLSPLHVTHSMRSTATSAVHCLQSMT
jgi:hypothetical protein